MSPYRPKPPPPKTFIDFHALAARLVTMGIGGLWACILFGVTGLVTWSWSEIYTKGFDAGSAALFTFVVTFLLFCLGLGEAWRSIKPWYEQARERPVIATLKNRRKGEDQ